jgi:DNA-directed RNA polymerase specialized sigma24 family protein
LHRRTPRHHPQSNARYQEGIEPAMSDRKIFAEEVVAPLFEKWRDEPNNRDQLAREIIQACEKLVCWQAGKIAGTTPLEFEDVAQQYRVKIYKILKHYQPGRGTTYSFLLNSLQNLGRSLLSQYNRRQGFDGERSSLVFVDDESLHDVADRHSFETWRGSL